VIRNCLCACAFAITAQQAAAQDSLSLRIVSAGLKPVQNAQIRVNDTATAVTDSAGTATIVVRSPWRVLARALGYSPLDTVLGRDSRKVDGRILLVMQRTQNLPTMEVRSAAAKPARYATTSRFDEFYERRARGNGRFFTREDIDDANKPLIVDLLRGIPGVRVIQARRDVPLSLRFARCTAAKGGLPPALGGANAHADMANDLVAVFVDGNRLNPMSAVEFIDGMKSMEVEAMEVYQGVSQLPMEARGNACAAIFIWTRFLPQASGRKP
jgi:hypothetical protein